MVRIALVQQRCEKAAIVENLASVSRHLSEAALHGVDIVGFPEMNITGYADPTRFPEAILRLDGPEMRDFLRRTVEFQGTVLAGLIEVNPRGKPFITQVVARQGEMLGIYRKLTIKDEEELWFSPGEDVPVFYYEGLTFGISICADIDNPHVFAECHRQGAQIVFELAAPGLYGEQATRNWQSGFGWWHNKCLAQLGEYARQYGYWIGAATQAGRTMDEDFPGGGYLFAPGGQPVFATKDWQPGVVYLEIDLAQGTSRAIDDAE